MKADVETSSETKLKVLAVPVVPTGQVPGKSISDIRETLTDVSDYLLEQSYGLTHVSYELRAPLKLDGTVEYYSSNHSEHINTAIASDTVRLLELGTDLRSYDYLIVFHAGKSVYQTHTDFGIYPFITNVPLLQSFFGSIKTVVVSEESESTTILQLVIRSMGVPYLTWYSQGQVGIGGFCIMGGGRAGLCAYTKMKLGYIGQDHVFVFENGTVQLELMPLSSTLDGFCVARYDIGEGLYYLVELREDIGRDSNLPRHGVLVTLVNETAISEEKPGIEIQYPRNCRYISEGPLVAGESWCASKTGFTVKVLTSSSLGANIVLSDSPVVNWSIVDRVKVAEQEEVRFLEIDHENDSFFGERLWAALGIQCGDYTYLRVYESEDCGRTWLELFNTQGTLNISNYNGKLTHYKGSPLFITWMQQGGDWFTGICWYYTWPDSHFFVTNLSSYCSHHLVPQWGLEATSTGDRLYLAIGSVSEGPSITFFSLGQDGWSNWTVAKLSLFEIRMTNAVTDMFPILYGCNASGLFRFPFNGSVAVQVSDALIWSMRCLQYDAIFLAFSLEENNESYCVLAESDSTGLEELVRQPSLYPNVLALSAWNKSISFLVTDANGTYLYRFSEGVDTRFEIDIETKSGTQYAMLAVIPPSYQWTPIIICHEGVLATVHYDFTVPPHPTIIVWSETIVPYNEYSLIIGVIGIVGFVSVPIALNFRGETRYRDLLGRGE